MAGKLLQSLPVRPRTAIAFVLLALVAIVVLIGKLIGGDATPLSPNGQSQLSTVDPTTGNDGVIDLDPSPSPKQPTTGPTAVAVATSFAENWIDKDRNASAWRSALSPLSTDTLTLELAEAEPISVPAERIVGTPSTVVLAESSVEVVFPMDSGKLRLRLIFVSGSPDRWLVDGIDWERV